MNGASDSRPVAAIGAPGGQRPLYSAVVALRRRPSEDANDPVDLPPAVPDEVIRVLSVLPSASIVTRAERGCSESKRPRFVTWPGKQKLAGCPGRFALSCKSRG